MGFFDWLNNLFGTSGSPSTQKERERRRRDDEEEEEIEELVALDII
ncbi:MAG TPA: hypothetical protein VMW63_09725 [Methanoregulaceae archaeon]|nr:hypothetical protein [Methanoregulaceae archaeon]